MASIQDQNDELSEAYPSFQTGAGQSLHIFKKYGGWSVWFNTQDHDFTGLCIATGEPTKAAALQRAVSVFEAAHDALQGPPRP